MENGKFFSAALAAMVGVLAPIGGLIVCAVAFVAIDFGTGVWASYKRAHRAGLDWVFSSRRAWDTLVKLVFVMAGICLAHLLDGVILTMVELNLAKIFTGFVCGVEFWSYLENAADISSHPVFRWVKKLLKKKFENLKI